MIPYGRQDITDADVDAVISALRSDWLTQGPAVPRLEEALSRYCDAKHAVAANSATSALHIACLALGLGPDDRLWTSPNSFVASANCALYCGAKVDFIDIDPHSYCISVDALASKLKRAAARGELPKIVVPVHFAGQSCDMRKIWELADCYGFRIIEDAAHALGGKYLNATIGDCRYSDVVVFSFHPVKIITTGEGGVALTNNAALAERMARLRSHGITRESALMEGDSEGPWYYQMLELGWNYRMTDIHAALGCSQMQRLDDYVTRRAALAERYDQLLADTGLGLPWRDPACASAWHFYAIRWNKRSQFSRAEVFTRLRAAGIGVNVHYIPIHMQPHFRAMGFRPGDFPNAESYYAEALTLPLFPRMMDSEQDHIVGELTAMIG